jgi:CubicO group peptidase (beta-lactamase class C family)
MRVEQDVPGLSAVVIRGNEIIFAGGSGLADIETERPANADTVYYIGSISKVLTAVLTLHLIEESQLDLDEPVTGIGVDTPAGEAPITIQHLLTHSSGLEREGDFGYWFSADFPDRDALSAYLARTSLRSEPGSKQHYSNIGFATLGRSIESATGLPYDAALEKYVLGPLQMEATGSPGPAPNVAQAYSPTGRLIPNDERPFAGVGKRVGGRHIRMYHDAKAMTPAFGVYSTAPDLGRLAMFLLGYGNDSVLSLAARKKMRQRQPTGRGLGIGLERDGDRLLLTHGGWFAAYRSQLLIDTTSEIAIVVLTNSDSAASRRIVDSLHRAALKDDN